MCGPLRVEVRGDHQELVERFRLRKHKLAALERLVNRVQRWQPWLHERKRGQATRE